MTPENTRKVVKIKHLKHGEQSPRGFDLYEVTEVDGMTVRNLRQLDAETYTSTKGETFVVA